MWQAGAGGRKSIAIRMSLGGLIRVQIVASEFKIISLESGNYGCIWRKQSEEETTLEAEAAKQWLNMFVRPPCNRRRRVHLTQTPFYTSRHRQGQQAVSTIFCIEARNPIMPES